MKHYLHFLITLLLLAIWGGEFCYGQTWQKVELKDLTSDDVFVIVDVLNGYAISNSPVTQKPKAVQVTLNEAGNELTGTISNNLKWKVSSDNKVYVFTSNANSDNVLYWAGKKTDIKIGIPTSDNKKNGYHKFVEATSDIYSGLKTQNATRYICNCSNGDWRCYEGGDKADGNNLKNNKTKLAYFKYVNDTRKATNVTFGEKVDGKTFDVTEGEESSFSEKIAKEKDDVAGTIKYSSDKADVVSVDETTGAVTFNKTKTFGTATITALFTPTDAATYKESSASYTINYKKKERIATTLEFATSFGTVNIGETFTLPELTLKAGDEVLAGKTFTYSSSAPKVASIDETGAVTIHSAGNTVLTAKFEDLDGEYKQSSADFTLKVIDPNAIVFSADDEAFKNVGTYSNTETEIDCKFVGTSGEYTFRVLNCMTNTDSGSLYGCLQMSSSDTGRGNGIVKSPLFDVFPNGYKVAVYYTKASTSDFMTISSKDLPDVKSMSTQTGDKCITTISLPLSNATFTMTANKGAKFVSKIELTPLAAPEIETVTLDETTNNDDVVKNNAGKTVNVTLKRTISDKYLNPFCVPFDMTADQITEVFGEGSVVSAFTSVTGKVMNFEKVTTITAGQPYIVQATKASTEISLDNVEMKSELGSNVVKESSELSMSFNGIVSPYTFKKNDGTELFLDKNGNLRYPSTVGSQMKGMRAYFEVLDGKSNEAKVNIGGGLSSIDKLMNGEAMTGKVYNLNGQYVGNTLDGLAKGLYIMNGKKYVVK